MNYVLILTLTFIAGSSNQGFGGSGVATASFKTLESCQSAAKKWEDDSKINTKDSYLRIYAFKRSAICVKK